MANSVVENYIFFIEKSTKQENLFINIEGKFFVINQSLNKNSIHCSVAKLSAV